MRRSATAVPRPAIHRVAYCFPTRRCAARPPAVEECKDVPTRPAGCPRGHQPWGTTRGMGEHSLSRHLGVARKSRCSRQTHAGWVPRTSRCCPALPTRPA